MKANFIRLKQMLEQEFPGQWSGIDGANYPAPEWTKLAANIIGALQMFTMVLVMVGDSIWAYIPGFRGGPPEVYYKMKDNPAVAFIMIFLVIPSYVQSFANSGGKNCLLSITYHFVLWCLQITLSFIFWINSI
jgi:hypothetical protein